MHKLRHFSPIGVTYTKKAQNAAQLRLHDNAVRELIKAILGSQNEKVKQKSAWNSTLHYGKGAILLHDSVIRRYRHTESEGRLDERCKPFSGVA